MYKIMIVEDDDILSKQIAERLIKWGFDAFRAERLDDVMSEYAQKKPHLILMDITLPYFDGFYWCKKIREISKVPILFLSSRDSNMDIIMAVNMGGDDYVTKPFSVDLLIAKINALLRRTYSYKESCDVLECDGVVLNLTESTLLYSGKKIEITKNEVKMLATLIRNRGKAVSRDRIMRALWEDDNFISDNTLTVNVNRLRSKLSEIGLKDFIVTKKGKGYFIE